MMQKSIFNKSLRNPKEPDVIWRTFETEWFLENAISSRNDIEVGRQQDVFWVKDEEEDVPRSREHKLEPLSSSH